MRRGHDVEGVLVTHHEVQHSLTQCSRAKLNNVNLVSLH